MTLDELKRVMESYEINYLIDVRTIPFSSHNPEFNKDNLTKNLKGYIWKGDKLGGKYVDCLDDRNYLDYEQVVKKNPIILKTLSRVNQLSADFNIVLMCSESDPTKCHRSRMLGRELYFRHGNDVVHLTPDGELKQSELMEQLTGGEWDKDCNPLFGDYKPHFKSSKPVK